MSQTNFDVAALRSFVTGMDLGSFAKAADRVGRSTSAVSAQIRKLEEQVGAPLFRKAGRGLGLTDAGEVMLRYARRLVELNDEAAVAARGTDLEGWVRLGFQEDFGESLLVDVLGRFARAHPKVRIEARVARNADLTERLDAGELDLALVWDDVNLSTRARRAACASVEVAKPPLYWIGCAAMVAGFGRAATARSVRRCLHAVLAGDRRARSRGYRLACRADEPESCRPMGRGGGGARADGTHLLRPAAGCAHARSRGLRFAAVARARAFVAARFKRCFSTGRAPSDDRCRGGAGLRLRAVE